MNTGFHKSNNLSIDPIPEQVELVAKKVLDSAFKVHTALGLGLLESVYEASLAHELKQLGLMFEAQILLPIVYDGMKVDTGLRLDLIVEKSVIIEIKAVDIVQAIHKAQLLTYLKQSGVRLGI